MKKFFHIKTYGCQMNVYDSEKISDLLKPMGFERSDNPDNCDITILNTCHIREKASEKMYSDIGRLSRLKENRLKSGHDMKIIVAGCVAQAEGEQIFKRNKNVDIVIGPQSYHKITKLLKKKSSKLIENNFPKESKFDFFPQTKTNSPTAFLTIQEGCDKFCSFCVVPYTRGAEFSRSVNEIVFEANHLVSQGVKEITLLGQNVSAYKGNFISGGRTRKFHLADLMNKLSEIVKLKRIRYLTSHPVDINSDLIMIHGKNKKIMPYLHLPIQSGSNRILKKMNRKHSRESYIEIIEKIRKVRKDIAITSDFIVGYPGESDSDFKMTLDLVKKINFAGSYSFKFSPRPGTPSAMKNSTVPQKTADIRLKILQEELNDQQSKFNRSFQKKSLSVLFEKKGKRENQYVGRSQYMQPVHVISNDNLIGKIKNVRIKNVESFSLHGNISKN